MTDIVTVAVDTGASGIKVIALVNDQPCILFIIAPHCIAINDNATEKADNYNEHRVWVKYGNEIFAVGTLAETLGATLRMKPAKFTTATPKILAAIGCAMQRLKLPPKFDLNLICVLPASEFDDRDIVIERVRSAIKILEFPSGKVRIKLKKINIYPEGYGLIQGQEKSPEVYSSMTMVMMGYRNISTFETKSGNLCKSHTSNYGFNYFLADVASQTGYSPEDLLNPILHCKPSKVLGEEYEKLYQERYHKIIKSEGKDREYEDAKIKRVVAIAKQSYVTKITEWLDEIMPDQTNMIVVGGGTTDFVWDDLYPFFAKRVNGDPNLMVLRDIKTSLQAKLRDIPNGKRFADIFSLLNFELNKD
jgi:Actin like proteins N terminal domain